jgi:hypothetical protein
VTWEELEACFVRVTSFGGALVVGGSYAVVTFNAEGVQQRGPSGLALRQSGGVLFQYQGFSFTAPALGLGGSMAGGTLIRVDR